MTAKNPYHVLSLSEDSTFEEIKDRYLHLSKNLHPDKQPIENYSITKKHFQQIEQAYKSIASPLRRYVFREFGLGGIGLVDEYPLEFRDFEGAEVELEDPAIQQRIKSLIIYMMHEQHAMSENDKSKIVTKSIVNMSRTLRMNRMRARFVAIPELQRNTFQYEMPLPDMKGLTSTFSVSQDSSGYEQSAKSSLDFSVTTMKRVNNSLLVSATNSISKEAHSFDLSADWLIGGNSQIRMSPLTVRNGQLGAPSVGFDKNFRDFSFSGVTDFEHVNFELNDSGTQQKSNRRLSKSVKLMMEKGALMVVPKVEYDLNRDLKVIAQVMGSFQEQNLLNFAFNYGYRFKISEEYKLEILSFTGAQNYLQVSLYSPKFRVNIPLVAEAEAVKIEAVKVSVLLAFYFSIKLFLYLQVHDQKSRKAIIDREYNRLSEETVQIRKVNSEAQALANDSFQRELKYNGLCIVKAFIGSRAMVQRISKIAWKTQKKFDKNRADPGAPNSNLLRYRSFKDQLNQQLSVDQSLKWGAIDSELFKITSLVKSHVNGGQIINMKVPEFKALLQEDSAMWVAIVYMNKGDIGVTIQSCNQRLNIGELRKNKATIFKRVHDWVADKLW